MFYRKYSVDDIATYSGIATYSSLPRNCINQHGIWMRWWMRTERRSWRSWRWSWRRRRRS